MPIVYTVWLQRGLHLKMDSRNQLGLCCHLVQLPGCSGSSLFHHLSELGSWVLKQSVRTVKLPHLTIVHHLQSNV